MEITHRYAGAWHRYVIPAIMSAVMLAGCDLFAGKDDAAGAVYRITGTSAPQNIQTIENGVPVDGPQLVGAVLPIEVDAPAGEGDPLGVGVAFDCAGADPCDMRAEVLEDGQAIAGRSTFPDAIADDHGVGVFYQVGAATRTGSTRARFVIDPDARAAGSFVAAVYRAGVRIGDGFADLAAADSLVGVAPGDSLVLGAETGWTDGVRRCVWLSVSVAVSDSLWFPMAGGRFCTDEARETFGVRAVVPE